MQGKDRWYGQARWPQGGYQALGPDGAQCPPGTGFQSLSSPLPCPTGQQRGACQTRLHTAGPERRPAPPTLQGQSHCLSGCETLLEEPYAERWGTCSGSHIELVTLRLEPGQACQGAKLTPNPHKRAAWQAPLAGVCRHRVTGRQPGPAGNESAHSSERTRLARGPSKLLWDLRPLPCHGQDLCVTLSKNDIESLSSA